MVKVGLLICSSQQPASYVTESGLAFFELGSNPGQARFEMDSSVSERNPTISASHWVVSPTRCCWDPQEPDVQRTKPPKGYLKGLIPRHGYEKARAAFDFGFPPEKEKDSLPTGIGAKAPGTVSPP